MTFHITYRFSPGQRDQAQKRFLETGALPPAGATMTGRWHCAEGHKGFLIAEAADVEAIGKWIQGWSDLLTFEVSPVLTDEQLGRVLS